ncbi:MAG: YlxR family protein [Deltaproteobacteria bacterium]|nr:YlxR family protein [Deltaproteobacteria bacterium]
MTLRSERRYPLRTCVQCGSGSFKESFLRIAGRPETGWEPDPDGRKPGRGIYLCRKTECVDGFVRRIRSPKGAARWKMGSAGAALADRVASWWSQEAKS